MRLVRYLLFISVPSCFASVAYGTCLRRGLINGASCTLTYTVLLNLAGITFMRLVIHLTVMVMNWETKATSYPIRIDHCQLPMSNTFHFLQNIVYRQHHDSANLSIYTTRAAI